MKITDIYMNGEIENKAQEIQSWYEQSTLVGQDDPERNHVMSSSRLALFFQMKYFFNVNKDLSMEVLKIFQNDLKSQSKEFQLVFFTKYLFEMMKKDGPNKEINKMRQGWEE